MNNPFMDNLILAGWDKVCEAVREAGRDLVTDPEKVVGFLRSTADALEKRKEFFRGQQSEGENVEKDT